VVVTAVAFWQIILAVHIAAVVVAFGATFAYPLFAAIGPRLDARAMPWFHQMQEELGRRLISPGLFVVLAAGIYLASDLHQWSYFYVQWGIAAVVVLGAVGGAFFAPNERKLAELARRDIEAAGSGEVQWSEEYQAISRRVAIVGTAYGVLVLVTLYLMTVQA
jgi:hypothetical protein